MELLPKPSTGHGPADCFTGDVWVDPVAQPDGVSQLVASMVRFTPGARTAWHTHPLGQTLYVTEGVGRVQAEGGEVTEIHPGDVVRIAPGERHWHGAAPGHFMTHLAMVQNPADGTPATAWAEHVTEAEYTATAVRPPAAD